MEDKFLAAILGAPADEVVRLAYADWLEERSDPRGRYLRAEVGVFQPAAGVPNTAHDRLSELADGLDPVWVARVSRPPVGVCCAGVRFVDYPGRSRPGLGPEAFALLDRWLGPAWPPAYRAFLLNYNGG